MFKKISNTYSMTIIFMSILILVSYINFAHSKNNMIQLIQDESEKTLNITVSRIQDHFSEKQRDLSILSEIIKKEANHKDIDDVNYIMNETYKKGDYYELSLIDAQGRYINRRPDSKNFVGKNIKEFYSGNLEKFIKASYETKRPQVSDVFRLDKNNLGISIIVPIVEDNNVSGMIVGICKTEDIGKVIIYGSFLNTENTVFGIDKEGIRVFSLHKELIGKDVYDNTTFHLSDLARANYKKMIQGIKFRGLHDGVYQGTDSNKQSNHDIEKKYIVSIPIFINGELKFSLAVTNLDNSVEFLDNFVYKELGLFLTFALLIGFLYYKIQRSYYEKNQLQKSLSESEASEKLKTEFFCNMSHELRTPLTVILNGLHFILKKHEADIEKDEDFKKMFLKIKQNALRLLKLVNNLLEISRIDAGMISRQPENLDIVKIVEDIAMSVVFYAQQKEIELIFDTEIEEKIIAVDEDGIERVIMNLLSNAIKFTSSGGKVLVNIYEDKEYINISIKDTGIGIPKDRLQVIFERFTQVNDGELIRTAEGTGIGLAIVKSIVEMHEGKIEVSSKKGEGTEFVVKIPNRIIDEKEVTTTKKLDQEILNNINIEFSDIK